MNVRKLGTSDLAISPLVLGGNVFGWTADERTSFRILDAFVDAGGTMIDTADVYSFWVEGHRGGESETMIGRWLRLNPAKRSKVQIATKIGFNDGLARDVIHRSCEASLKRLGIERIDLLYQHRDDSDVPLAESLGAFHELKSEDKIRAVGLSQFSPERIAEAVAVAEREGLERPCALQSWYSLVDRERLEGSLVEAALRHQLGIIPFYVLANGFLTGKYRSNEDLAKSVRGARCGDYLEKGALEVLAAMDEIAAETHAPLAAIAIAWVLARPGIVGALASATSVRQLADSLAALQLHLTPAQIQYLDDASRRYGP